MSSKAFVLTTRVSFYALVLKHYVLVKLLVPHMKSSVVGQDLFSALKVQPLLSDDSWIDSPSRTYGLFKFVLLVKRTALKVNELEKIFNSARLPQDVSLPHPDCVAFVRIPLLELHTVSDAACAAYPRDLDLSQTKEFRSVLLVGKSACGETV